MGFGDLLAGSSMVVAIRLWTSGLIGSWKIPSPGELSIFSWEASIFPISSSVLVKPKPTTSYEPSLPHVVRDW